MAGGGAKVSRGGIGVVLDQPSKHGEKMGVLRLYLEKRKRSDLGTVRKGEREKERKQESRK